MSYYRISLKNEEECGNYALCDGDTYMVELDNHTQAINWGMERWDTEQKNITIKRMKKLDFLEEFYEMYKSEVGE